MRFRVDVWYGRKTRPYGDRSHLGGGRFELRFRVGEGGFESDFRVDVWYSGKTRPYGRNGSAWGGFEFRFRIFYLIEELPIRQLQISVPFAKLPVDDQLICLIL